MQHSWTSVLLLPLILAVAVAAPAAAATFSPASGSGPASLIPGDPQSGTISITSSGVVERVAAGRADRVLSLSLDIHNRSGRDLVLKPLDVWVVTEGGTVLSLPELRLDGLSVTAAQIPAGRKGRLVALFRLGPVEAFTRFDVHWAGRLEGETVAGEAAFASADGGYVPPAGGDVAGGEYGDAGAVEETPDGLAAPGTDGADRHPCDEDEYDRYDCYGYSYGYYPYGHYPYYAAYPYSYRYPYFHFGLGYYGFFGHHRHGHHHHGGTVFHGRSARQVKEDAILHRTGTVRTGGTVLPRGRSGSRVSRSASPPSSRGNRGAGVRSRGGSSVRSSAMRSGGGSRSAGSMRSGGGRSRSAGSMRSGGGRSRSTGSMRSGGGRSSGMRSGGMRGGGRSARGGAGRGGRR